MRNRILDDLSESFARNLLGVDEYEQRVQAVIQAGTVNEVLAVNKDILPPERYSSTEDPSPQMMSEGTPGVSRECIAIFSGTSLKGRFDAPDHLEAVAIFGGCDIDLREARIPPGGMDIEVNAIFGGVEIRVPGNANLQVHVAGIFGGTEHPPFRDRHNGPELRIHGAAIFGGVEIKY